MTVEDLKNTNWIIFEGIGGSKAAGMNTKGSDTDIRGIYRQPVDDILRGKYIPQIADKTQDIIYYEIGRFLELLKEGNPNILEILNLPDDCILHTSSLFKRYLYANRRYFITQHLKRTFGNYALNQIKKSRGLNKKISWEQARVRRRDVLDFCYVLKNKEQSVPFYETGYTGEYISLAKVNNFTDLYSMYFVYPEMGGIMGKSMESIKVNSIPKSAMHLGYLRYDQNAYSTHCKDYRQYNEWLKNRNTNRVTNQGYDTKNMAICFKLLRMAKDIAQLGEIVVRRPDAEFLLDIKKGVYSYDELLEMAQKEIEEVEVLFNNSALPDDIDIEFIQQTLLNIRKHE